MATTQQTTADNSYSGHVLPPYFEKIQRYLVLPLLLLAEFYVNGLLSVRGIVPNLGQPDTWDWYGWIGVVIMFLAIGIACAGIAVGLSGRCAEAFARGRWYAFPLLLGVIAFAGIEFYAGISERSVNLVATPADTAFGHVVGLMLSAATPASIMASFILPIATIFYGFALKPPQVELAQERAERHAREEAEAAHKAKMTALKAQGIGAALGGGIRAAKAQVTGDDTTRLDGGIPTGSDDGNHEVTGGDTAGYDSASGQSGYGAKAPVSIKRGSWTSRQLKDYAHETYGVDVSDIEAANTMKVLSKGRKSGAAYVASSRVVKAWVDERYSAGSGDAEPTGTSPR